MENCCNEKSQPKSVEKQFEKIFLEKTTKNCALCEDYAKKNTEKEYAILSCEGACLRGEISRQVANLICHELVPDKTVRICMGGAFTKDTGQRALVRKAKKVLAIEGCMTDCASRTMRAVLPEINPIIIETDKLADFNKSLFGIDEMSHDEIIKIAKRVAEQLKEEYVL